MGYMAELEAMWLERGGNRTPAPPPPWPKGLRGSDMIKALHALVYEYEEETRFADAIIALMEHGVVDKYGHFNKSWRPPLETQREEALYNGIEAMKQHGWSVLRACAEFAARSTPPAPGNSFQAAVNRLRDIHRKVAKIAQQKNDNDS